MLFLISPLPHFRALNTLNTRKSIPNFNFESIFRWVLHPKGNRQNDRHWAPYNPHVYEESNIQGDVKAMSWVRSLKPSDFW